MIEYWIEYSEVGMPVMKFKENPEIVGSTQELAEWLAVTVKDYKETLDKIDAVLIGKDDSRVICGNEWEAIVEKEYSTVKCTLFEDGLYGICKLPTKLLREIVEVWLEEYDKYLNSKK